jgi:hypothetical protein
MKRLLAVLAVALILILTYWENSSSKSYPIIVIEDVQFDHPWGGEQNDPNPPVNNSITPAIQDDFIIIRMMKYWNYRILYNPSFFRASKSTGTTSTTSTNDSNTSTNQAPSQRGMGQ